MGETGDVAARKQRVDIETPRGLEKLSKRIRTSYSRITKSTGGADDCVQEVLCRMFEGKHQHSTIDQCVIDYLRTDTGRKGAPGYTSRLNLINADTIGPRSDDESDGLDYGRVGFDPGASEGIEGFDWVRCVTRGLSRDEKIIVSLKANWGFREIEIANLFGVSESRISQRVKRIQERISARIEAQERTKISRDAERKVAKVLPGEKEGGPSLEFEANEGMERKEPGEMGSFNGESVKEWASF